MLLLLLNWTFVFLQYFSFFELRYSFIETYKIAAHIQRVKIYKL